jgi:GH15 family glucan-1,4-alpha-glucosidase
MPARIEDYALIGDCETAALVCRDGSIDWLCWPRFDSPACFAALLGSEDNGRWRVAPREDGAKVTRRYLPDTLILETTFTARNGVVRLTDFMPPRGTVSDIVRLVTGVSGRVEMRSHLALRFCYGSSVPWVTRGEDGTLRAVSGPDMVLLRTTAPLHPEGLTTCADFTVAAGETVPFELTYQRSHLDVPDAIDPARALEATREFWESWAAQGRHAGPHADEIKRSLITLKALTYAPTGGVVAAPTTSLPEFLGGTRNWDYRFCWVRDSTLTLLALMNSGHFDEARAWRNWLLRAAAGSPSQIQIMYGLAGERWLPELTVPWLAGYEDSLPVRIGNAAADQLQIDVFGEVMDTMLQARIGGLQHSGEGWDFQRALLDHAAEAWRKTDHGIWEVRGQPEHFTYSKVMAWVAFDRGIKTAEKFGLEGPVERWRKIRAEIHDEVCAKAFNPRIGAFAQSYGSDRLDAATLLIPTVGFLPHDDKRVRGTIAAIEKRLMRQGFVLRYDTEETDDGLPPGEGAFLACSFWLADAYVLSGRGKDALALFERLLSLRNDLGLLAEEYDPRPGRQVGNFPQAFSHVALINTAHNLEEARKPAEQRSDTAAPDSGAAPAARRA